MNRLEILNKLAKAVLESNEIGAKRAAEEAIAEGIDPLEAIQEGLAKGMSVIGEKFEKLEVFLPQVMLGAEAMKAAMDVLLPKIAPENLAKARLGKVVIGTVSGDIHDIGKNLVATLLSVAGFEVHDLGSDVPAKKFVEKAEEIEADIIALSCLLTPSMFFQKDVISYLNDMGVRDKYYIILGGGAITPEWVGEIRADGWGKYAEDAVKVCKLLITERPSRLGEPLIIGEKEEE